MLILPMHFSLRNILSEKEKRIYYEFFIVKFWNKIYILFYPQNKILNLRSFYFEGYHSGIEKLKKIRKDIYHFTICFEIHVQSYNVISGTQ